MYGYALFLQGFHAGSIHFHHFICFGFYNVYLKICYCMAANPVFENIMSLNIYQSFNRKF